jgi:O-antigen/teichoic acid export membrane protein
VSDSVAAAPAAATWGKEGETVAVVAHNVSTRYLAYTVEAILGVVMLPFNLAHLGVAAYGLWMLTASLTAYFSMLDLGYGGALVRFVAQYRARRDARSLNEVLSTLAVVYAGIGALTYGLVVLAAYNLDSLLKLTPGQVATSQALLLIVGAHVALRFLFGVFGGVIVGFQRYHLNNITSIATSIAVAIANVAVLLMGYGVVALVAVTTAVRVAALLVYLLNAYRVFPGLHLSPGLFRVARLREVSGFSVYMLALDSAYKLNYSTDVLVIGAMIGAPAVAFWSPAQRLGELALKLSNQLSEALFPIVVDCDAAQRAARLRTVFVEGTKLSLATAIPMAGGLAMLALPLLTAWIGDAFAQTATILQILAVVVIVRVGSSTASVVLKGAGMHRRLAAMVGAMAIVNLALSVALVAPLGLVGVAVGTLVPVTLVSLFGYFPAACRRVGISVPRLLYDAVWPAVWPAVFAAALLAVTRQFLPPTLPAVALQFVAGGTFYIGLFMVAVGRESRREYLRHADRLLRRAKHQMRHVGTANASS